MQSGLAFEALFTKQDLSSRALSHLVETMAKLLYHHMLKQPVDSKE